MGNHIKVCIFGGSFDPFHIGHLRVIEGLIQLKKFDQIIVMPLGLAPHKNYYMTPAGYRFEMTRLALQNYPEVWVSDYEINRPGKYSYTLDTIEYFTKEIKLRYLLEEQNKLKVQSSKRLKAKRTIREENLYQQQLLEQLNNLQINVKLSLVYGSDALDTIESWHEPVKLMREAKLWICRRGDESIAHMNERADYLRQKYHAKIKFFDINTTEVSGTWLRESLTQGVIDKELLPKAVRKFIKNNGIYLFNEDMAALSRENLIRLGIYENDLRKQVSRSRYIHCLNVMQYAVHLARVHHYDLMKAATTGILHDIAKSMRINKQYKYAKKLDKLNPVNKNIAHGPAGAFYIKKFLGIADQEILDALVYHTTSRPGMSTLDKIIYLADKLEYGRPFENLEPVREAAEKDLDEAMRLCLAEVEMALKRRNREGHPCTISAIEYLNR